MRLAAGIATLVAGLAALALHCSPLAFTGKVDLARVSHWGGHAYAAPILGQLPGGPAGHLIQPRSDDGRSPHASQLRLFEGANEVGPGHTVHAEIAARGAGRFSHWRGDLVFSASDNSDPRTNGRSYSYRARLAPQWWLVAGLLLAAFALLGHTRPAARLSAHRSWLFWTAAGALALWMNVALGLQLPAPIPYPDSNTYLTWSILRTVGYPILAYSYHFATGNWAGLPLFQLNLALAGLFVLAHAVVRVSGSHAMGWLVLCATAGAGTLLLSSTDLLTEAPFAALVTAHAGLAILYFHGARKSLALASGLALAAAVTMKSVAVVLLGPLALVAAFAAGKRRALLLLVLVPGLLAWLLPSAYNAARFGTFESSHAGGFALSGHVAWAIRPEPGSPVAPEAALVERRIAPVLARRPASFASTLAYVDYTANEYNVLLWANMIPELQAHYEGRPKEPCSWDGRDRTCVVRQPLTMNRTLLRLAREAIAREPGAYAGHVAAHHYGLWRDLSAPSNEFVLGVYDRAALLPAAYDPAKSGYASMLGRPVLRTDAERLADAARLYDSAAKRLVDLATLREAFAWLVGAAYRYPAILLALSLACCLPVFGFARVSPASQALCYCALVINAYYLGTALAQPSLVRYAAAMQGLAAAMTVLALHAGWRAVYDRVARRLRRPAAIETNPDSP